MRQPTNHPPTRVLARVLTRPLLCGLMSVALANAALATDPLYEVNYPASYTIPPDGFPLVDATNVVVDNGYSFIIDFASSDLNPPLFETWNTLNYTNYGWMVCNTGFLFDRQITNSYGDTQHLPAASFYNPGSVLCGSTNVSSGSSTVVSTSGAEFIVNATSISMPGGTVSVGASGLLSINGQNVDLSDSTLTMEGGGGTILALRGSSYAGYGVDTNAEWNPTVDLTATTAMPSEVRIGNTGSSWEDPPGFPSYPATTTPYYAEYDLNTNLIVYQYVFLNNMMSNVTATVELFYSQASGRNKEQDIAEVQFTGSGVNPATGLPFNSYIFFENDYAAGAGNPAISASTGIPNNFLFEISDTPLLTGTGLASGFLAITNQVAFSNRYSFVDVHCLPTTVDTNTPSNQLTNYLDVLPGRIDINVNGNLNLTGAQISGQNYLSVNAPQEYDNVAGASISSAYSSIDVGKISGDVVVTNLVSPTVPAWSGTLAAWTTRWTTVYTNSILSTDTNNVTTTNSFMVTNDFSVLIMANQAVPSTPSAVWNLFVRGTNSIVLSDADNILHGLYLDCQRLTLTTNGPGAQSPYGELNLQGTTVNWAAATPNLRYLTNNGVILLPLTGLNSQGVFGSASMPYAALINNGQISDPGGSQIWAANFVNSGTIASGTGRFTLQSQTTTLTGGSITAGGDVSITTGSLLTGGLALEAAGSLTLTASNQLADTGVNSGGVWTVGLNSVGTGIVVPLKPPGGGGYGNSLLGTTINLYAPINRNVVNLWPGADLGVSVAGFTNNLAVGRLILDALGTTASTRFTFNGAGAGNAIYVDYLELDDGATNLDNGQTGTNFISLNFNTNLVIYYAQAVMNGHSVARQINHFNSDHLRWVPQYAGRFSSTNIVYPDGTTNTVNAALAQAPHTDSNQNGTPNAYDPAPFFVPSEVHFTVTVTNKPPLQAMLTWISIPGATNFVYYSTNLTLPITNLLTTITNSPAPPYAPLTNVVYDPVNPAQPRFYRVTVYPNSTDLYGPGF
jgi:hypothetical protein